MRINSLIDSSSLLINFSATISLGNISSLFNRVIHTASENSRKDLRTHTERNRKNTLQVQENRKHALIDRNSTQTQALKNASFFHSYITPRKAT
ncbi:MAG: hypothetical protein ACH349_01100 [Candidatus Rhabdochlamydia sp.]|jgi:hypothetical protein|nr:hypothetical protein [Chlamydiota bacterium]